MKWFKWFGKSTSTKNSSAGSRSSFRLEIEQFGGGEAPRRSMLRSFKPEVEQMEERQLMSATGIISTVTDLRGVLHEYAISTGAGYPGGTLQEMTSTHVRPWGGFEYFANSSWQGHNGPQLLQISAGRDANGNAECFGISASDHTVWVWQQNIWQHLGGQWSWQGWQLGYQYTATGPVFQISAGDHGSVYALTEGGLGGGTLEKYNPSSGWVRQDRSNYNIVQPHVNLIQISAGEDRPNGQDILWAIDGFDQAWSLDASGWTNWGGNCKQISGTVHGNVYVIDSNNGIDFLGIDGHWVATGGYGSEISAGTDWSGQNDRVFQIGLGWDHGVYEYSQYGPQAGWKYDGGYAFEIAGTNGAGQGGRVMLIGGEGAAWMLTNWPPYNGVGYTEWDYEAGFWLPANSNLLDPYGILRTYQ